jgi:hypothetical protein
LGGDVVYYVVLYAPLYKVQLRDSGLNRDTLCVGYLVLKLFGPAKGVKELLAVPIKTRLVCAVNRKRLSVVHRVRQIFLFRVIGYEPFELP